MGDCKEVGERGRVGQGGYEPSKLMLDILETLVIIELSFAQYP